MSISEIRETTRAQQVSEQSNYGHSVVGVRNLSMPILGLEGCERARLDAKAFYTPRKGRWTDGAMDLDVISNSCHTYRTMLWCLNTFDRAEWHLPIMVNNYQHFAHRVFHFSYRDHEFVVMAGSRGGHEVYYAPLMSTFRMLHKECLSNIFNVLFKHFWAVKSTSAFNFSVVDKVVDAFRFNPVVNLCLTMHPTTKTYYLFVEHGMMESDLVSLMQFMRVKEPLYSAEFVAKKILRSPLHLNTFQRDFVKDQKWYIDYSIYVKHSFEALRDFSGYPKIYCTDLDKYLEGKRLVHHIVETTELDIYREGVYEHVNNTNLYHLARKIMADCWNFLPNRVTRKFLCWPDVQVLKLMCRFGFDEECCYRFDKRLKVCARCLESFNDCGSIIHCITDQQYKEFELQYRVFFSGVYYWLEKALPGVAIPIDWLCFAFRALSGGPYVLDDPIRTGVELKYERATMFGALAGASENLDAIASTSRAVTGVVQQMETSNIVPQLSAVLSNFNSVLVSNATALGHIVTAAEVAAPLMRDGFSIDSFLEVFNGMARAGIKKVLDIIFVGNDNEEFLESIRFTTIIKNIYLLRHTFNSVARALLLTEIVNCLHFFDMFSRFFALLRDYYNAEPYDDTADPVLENAPGAPQHATMLNFHVPDLSEWLSSLFSGTVSIYQFFSGIVCGIVGSVVEGVAWIPTLRTWLRSVGNFGRDLGGIGQGIAGLGRIIDFIQNCYYTAKQFLCDKMGISIQTPLTFRLKEKTISFLTAIDLVSDPSVRATMVTHVNSPQICESLLKCGRELCIHVGQDPSTRTLGSQLNKAIDKLIVLRTDINWYNGTDSECYVPFVVHINGPANCGKSALAKELVKALCVCMGIRDKTYPFNEMLPFMDGYAQQECVIVDDVNLVKDVDRAVWIIKMVGPNRDTLPVATNERRPLYSNIKLIIATSNVPYTPINEIATPDGIDRRSSYKFECSPDTTVYQNHALSISACDDANWDIWGFKRIPSCRGDTLEPADRFEGRVEMFMHFLIKNCVNHHTREMRRLARNGATERAAGLRDLIMDKLYGICSLGPRAEHGLNWEPSMIQKHLVAIEVPLIVPVAGPEVSTVGFKEWLADLSEDQAEAVRAANLMFMDRLKKAPPSSPFTHDSVLRWYEDQGFEMPESYGPPRLRWFPVFITHGHCIRFEAEAHDYNDDVNLINTGMIRPWSTNLNGRDLNFDRRFIAALKFGTEEFYIDEYLPMTLNNDYAVPNRDVPLTYALASELIASDGFLDSARNFFSLNVRDQFVVFSRWKSYIWVLTTVAAREIYHESFFMKCTRFAARTLRRFEGLMWVCVSFTSLCVCYSTVAMMFGAFRDALPENCTSQLHDPKSPKGLRGNRSTSSIDGVKNKILSNVYRCTLSTMDADSGHFNALGLEERFFAIPKHCLRDQTLRLTAEDHMAVIKFWSPLRKQYIVYWFDPKLAWVHPTQDLAIIFVDGIEPVKSIVKYMPNEMAGIGMQLRNVCMYEKTDDGIVQYDGKYSGTDKDVKTATRLNKWIFKNMYCYHMVARQGTSGAPIVLDETHPYRLMAIQSSMGHDWTHGTPLIRSTIEEALVEMRARIDVPTHLPSCDVEFDEIATCGLVQANFLGITTQTVKTSPKTELRKTPMYGILGKPSREPVFNLFRGEDRIDAMMNKTTLTHLSPYSSVILNETVNEYASYWRTHLLRTQKEVPSAFVSIDVAVAGDYIGGKPMDLAKSPGIGVGDWIHVRKKSGHRDWIDRDGDKFVISKELRNVVSDELNKLFSKDASTSTFAAFPKDELRNKAPRGIDGSPMEQKILYRMLFGRIDALLAYDNDGTSIYGPGINLLSIHGYNLRRRITDHICMWDFSKYDSTIIWQLYSAVVDFYNLLIDDDEPFKVARRYLAYKTCMATIVCEGYVYQPMKGMRSGFGGTASFNTHIHNLVLTMTIKKILIARGLYLAPTLFDVLDICDWITYADDGLLWLKDLSYKDVINGETISIELIHQGWLVADPRGKNDLPPRFVSFEECVFLKQTPVVDDYILDCFPFPVWRIEFDSIRCAISYFRGSDPYEALESVFIFLLSYGPELFEHYRMLINRRIEQRGLSYVYSFRQLRDRIIPPQMEVGGCFSFAVEGSHVVDSSELQGVQPIANRLLITH